MEAQALWTTGPGRMALRRERLAPAGADEVLLRALNSGVSRGTEGLVLAGRVPASEHVRMRCPYQDGSFPFPVKYGYALVGVVEAGPAALVGRAVFALHPHQDRVVLPASAVLPLPPGLPPALAVLAANLETALTVTWDCGAAPGDRVLVVGAGVVGLLTARLIAAIPGTEVVLTDRRADRAAPAAVLGLSFRALDELPEGVDIAVNASGSGSGLQTAIDAAGREAVVVEASWHGDAPATLSLGGGFHVKRLTLKSSQVGSLPPTRTPRWDHRRRLALALELLVRFPELEALLGPEIPFDRAPDLLPPLLAAGGDALCPLITYA